MMKCSGSSNNNIKNKNRDWGLWLSSQLIDYAALAILCIFLHFFHHGNHRYYGMELIWIMSLQGAVSIAILYFRERLHYALLGVRVATAKRLSLTHRDWMFVLQMASFSMANFAALSRLDLMEYPTGFLASWKNIATVYGDFLLMLALRDIFSMLPFHSLMHDNATFYKFHKTHHEIRRQAQAMHAFHIDLPDLIIENSGAPVILLLAKHLLRGSSSVARLHWFAGALLALHDSGLHSVNPYTSLYFHPLLDYFCKGNVCHQLHHALNKGYIAFVPTDHVWSSRKRKRDTDLYNQVFQTDFSF